MNGTRVCSACGAPVRLSDGACRYCSAEIPPDPPPAPVAPSATGGAVPSVADPYRVYCVECGQHHARALRDCPRCPPIAESERKTFPEPARCPKCREWLAGDLVGSARVERCRACGGAWFDRGEVARAIQLVTHGGLTKGQVAGLERALGGGAQGREAPSRTCPRCAGRLFRRLVAQKGPAFVDVCPAHGVWFDEGEFEAFRAFVGRGGLEIARDREDQGIRARPASHNLSEPGAPPTRFFL